jgi:anti-anti-sigma factor
MIFADFIWIVRLKDCRREQELKSMRLATIHSPSERKIEMSETPVASVEQTPLAVVVHILPHHLVAKSDLDAICGVVDREQVAAPSLPFIIDMANVAFMGSLAMGMLVGLRTEFKTRGQRMIFVGLQIHVHHSLTVSHLDRIVEIMSDVPAALESVGGGD